MFSSKYVSCFHILVDLSLNRVTWHRIMILLMRRHYSVRYLFYQIINFMKPIDTKIRINRIYQDSDADLIPFVSKESAFSESYFSIILKIAHCFELDKQLCAYIRRE